MSPVRREQEEFRGTRRFELVRRLGSGGMGVVYEVLDRESGQHVALKTLRRLSPGDLYRFKREFRALADTRHPNLVTLYELVCVEGLWFFTMELVAGTDLITFVRGARAYGRHFELGSGTRPAPWVPDTLPLSDQLPHDESSDEPFPAPPDSTLSPEARIERLRPALRQLCVGLTALHAAGKIHRDIKPSNILVTPERRVVLLDFGLVTEAGASTDTESGVAGTLRYMAPEQLTRLTATPAADWYAVGTVLYEALTGHLPFTGPLLEVLHDKQTRDPEPPQGADSAIAPALSDLCRALLHRDPTQRPAGEEVMERLGTPPRARRSATPPALHETDPFVGREIELAELRARWREVQVRQCPVVVLIGGSGGIGKTALTQGFLRHLRAEANAPLVLTGRCYERESVPFKAFDAMVDELGHRLMQLPGEQLALLLPPDIHLLAAMFPVLQRIPLLREHTALPDVPEPAERRKRTFAAFARLLEGLTRLHPVVLWIDDLQWADDDSFELLRVLARGQRAGPLVLLATFRNEPEPGPGRFAEALAELSSLALTRTLSLGPLSDTEATELARILLTERVASPANEEDARELVAEAGGNPFFIGELVRFVRGPDSRRDDTPRSSRGLQLHAMFAERVESLPEHARSLLELVAIAGEAIPKQVLLAAAGSAPSDEVSREEMALLRAERLIRERGPREVDTTEAYHDRIREMVVATLSPEQQREHHRLLAEAFEQCSGDHIDRLALHWAAAGQPDRALEYLVRAGQAASDKLAFERAAELYRAVLRYLGPTTPQRARISQALGDALACSGRSAEAVRAYRDAIPLADGPSRLELRRLVARHLAIAGHVREGMVALNDVLAEIGMRLPTGPTDTLASLTYHRARLALRGLRFEERSGPPLSPEALQRLEILHTVATMQYSIDPPSAAVFQARFCLEALDSGDLRLSAEALSLEAMTMIALGGGKLQPALSLLARAEVLARRAKCEGTRVQIVFVRGGIYLHAGQWEDCVRALAEADEPLTRGYGAHQLRSVSPWFQSMALVHQGRLALLNRRLGDWLESSHQIGDRMFATQLRTACNIVWLARDDIIGALRDLRAVMDTWPQDRYTIQHFTHLLARTDQAMYTGGGEEAWSELQSELPRVRRALFLRNSLMRTLLHRHLGKAALLAAVVAPESARKRTWLKHARRSAQALERESMGYAIAWGKLIRAAVYAQEGSLDRDALRRNLDEAVSALEVADCRAVAAAARRQLGRIVGGAEGARLVHEADESLANEGVRAPKRFAAFLAPGFAP